MKYLLVLCLFIFSCKAKEFHTVRYTFIDTIKNDTSWEVIDLDNLGVYFIDTIAVYNKYNMNETVEKVLKYGNRDTTIYFSSGIITWSGEDLSYGNNSGHYYGSDTVFIHDTISLKRKKVGNGIITGGGAIPKDNTDQVFYGWECDYATKIFNVEYWKTQCEIVKHHNEVLPEESYSMPQLSADSCMVTFPL